MNFLYDNVCFRASSCLRESGHSLKFDTIAIITFLNSVLNNILKYDIITINHLERQFPYIKRFHRELGPATPEISKCEEVQYNRQTIFWV